MSMWDWYDNQWKLHPTRMLISMLLIIFALGGFGLYLGELNKQLELNYKNYLVENKCVKTGFAGKYAEPVYTCATGLFVEREIRQMVR